MDKFQQKRCRSFNHEVVAAQSPGCRTRLPGNGWVQAVPVVWCHPEGVAPVVSLTDCSRTFDVHCIGTTGTTLRVWDAIQTESQGSRVRLPWALGRNPFVVDPPQEVGC